MGTILVSASPGDSLCSIAKRYGHPDCRPLRQLPDNESLLNAPLTGWDTVTVPRIEMLDRLEIRTTERTVLVVHAPRQPVDVRFIRPKPLSDDPSDRDEINELRISRYPTDYCSYDYDTNAAARWVDDTVRDYDAPADGDPACFCVEVVDPNEPGANVTVVLEALRPAGDGTWRRFNVNQRGARSLDVTASRMNRDNTRHRSCYVRLVVDETDKARRNSQTLLVTDMVDDGDPALEIVDQHVEARYEDRTCPLPQGSRCLLAVAEAALPKSESVDVNVWVLRSKANGRAAGDETDCVVPFSAVRRRILKNTRRIWAQDAITFTIGGISALDPPSDILAVSDPEGERSKANSRIGLEFTIDPFSGFLGGPQGVIDIPLAGGKTATETANAIASAMRDLRIGGLQVNVVQNRARLLSASRSADVVPVCGNGRLRFTLITLEGFQDADQKIRIVRCDPDRFDVRSGIKDIQIGSGMQRMTYRRAAVDPHKINIFVAGRLVGATAQTINSAAYLPAPCQPEPGMENCIIIPRECMGADLNVKPATLAHEIGHALMDHAEHPNDGDTSCGSLMTAATSESGNGNDRPNSFLTKRIPETAHGWLYIAEATWGATQGGWQDRGWGLVGIVNGYQYAMSRRIRTHGTITRTAR